MDLQIAGRLMGLIVGALWPAVLLGAVVTGRLPKTPTELRRQVAERDKRIAELEQELGIGQRPRA